MSKRRFLPIVFSLGLIICAICLVIVLEPTQEETVTKVSEKQPVTVTVAIPQAFYPNISLLGTTQARWELEIKAPDSARLTWLNGNAEPGTLVKKGAVIAKLDTTHLKSRLAQAHRAMKQAELELQKEKHEQTVALKMLSSKKSSAYARREPQIAAAKASLSEAIEAHNSAKKHLKDATIVAPYDAVILSRNISPGQQVETGSGMFRLASSTSLDVKVAVPNQQWKAITKVLDTPKIQIVDRQGHSHPATVRYVAPQVDKTSRQRLVMLAVNDPYRLSPRLLPNQQVKVELRLALHNSVCEIPLSAITRDGQVWTIDDKDRLRKERITLLEEHTQNAFVVFEQNPEQVRKVVTYPLLSMLTGIQVKPIMNKSSTADTERSQ